MPGLIRRQLIWDWRSRSDKGHVSSKHVNELWEFIETGSSEEFAHSCDPLVACELVDALIPFRFISLQLPCDHLSHELFVNAMIVINIHGSKLQESKLFSMLANPLLPEKNRPRWGWLDPEFNPHHKKAKQKEQK